MPAIDFVIYLPSAHGVAPPRLGSAVAIAEDGAAIA